MARALEALGAQAVCITGGDASDGLLAHDWLHTPHAQGWLSLPRVDTRHHHGTGCTFATALASALARGFVSADAAVFAKMATTHALRHARAIGQGAGPVIAVRRFRHCARSAAPSFARPARPHILGHPCPGARPRRLCHRGQRRTRTKPCCG